MVFLMRQADADAGGSIGLEELYGILLDKSFAGTGEAASRMARVPSQRAHGQGPRVESAQMLPGAS